MSDEIIVMHNRIHDMADRLLNFENRKTFNLYTHLYPLISYRATILLLCLEQKSSVSTEEIKFIGAILESLSEKGSFEVSELYELPFLSFTLTSHLKSYHSELGNKYFISATPQGKCFKSFLNDVSKPFEIDLLIELYLVSDSGKIRIANAALEYDGPFHLQEKNIRKDKFRDSCIQAKDIPVFRLPSQNTHLSALQGRKEFSSRLDMYIDNVNQFFRKRIHDYERHILEDRKANLVAGRGSHLFNIRLGQKNP